MGYARLRIPAGKENSYRKYRAKRTVVDGVTFASKKEARRYSELKLLLAAGQITNLELQVPFSLDVNDVHICNYLADFQYLENGKKITEDVKGMRTREYVLKCRLMKAIHGIDIRET